MPQPPSPLPQAALLAQPVTSVAVIGTSQGTPTVAIGVDWIVLVPIIATAVCTIIGVFFSTLLSYKNGKKADAIHVLVNSGMTKALSDLSTAQEEIRTLRDLVNALNARVIGDASIAAGLAIVQARKDANMQPSTAVTVAQAATPKPSTP